MQIISKWSFGVENQGNPWDDLFKRDLFKTKDKSTSLQAKLVNPVGDNGVESIFNDIDFDMKPRFAAFKAKQSCNKVNGMELGFIENMQNTHVFKSSDCFCGEAMFCSYSYSKADSGICSISAPMTQNWNENNCDMIKRCQKSKSCDGIAFDGSSFSKINCSNSGIVAYSSGKNRQYLIQLLPC